MPHVPLFNRRQLPLDHPLEVEVDGDQVTLRLNKGYTGKAVEETFSRSALLPLAGPNFQSNEDVVGLSFESEGDGWIHGLVGVGSGNERFLMKAEDFAAALG